MDVSIICDPEPLQAYLQMLVLAQKTQGLKLDAGDIPHPLARHEVMVVEGARPFVRLRLFPSDQLLALVGERLAAPLLRPVEHG